MSEKVQCDNCNKLVFPSEYQHDGDWWRVEGVGELRTRMVNTGTPMGPWDYCSLKCLAEGTSITYLKSIEKERNAK